MKCRASLGRSRSIEHAYRERVRETLGDRNFHLAKEEVIFFDAKKEQNQPTCKWCVLHFRCRKTDEFMWA